MRIAFHSPLKTPESAVPSGDRRVARLLMAALLAFPALVTVNLARARSAPSTLHLATRWAERGEGEHP